MASGLTADALQLLLQYESEFAGTVAYDYTLGVVALEAGDYRVALHALERVVLNEPEHAGAWIDLAVTHIHLREYVTAETLLAYVEEHFQPPAELLAHIRDARSQLQRSRWLEGWHGEVGVQLGSVSNVNSGVALSGITLTPQGSTPIYLELDPSRRPQASAALQWRGIFQYSKEHSESTRSEWLGVVRGREYTGVTGFDANDLGLAYAYYRPTPWQSDAADRLILGGGFQRLYQGGNPLANILNVQMGIRRQWGACYLLGRLESEQRSFLLTGYFDARLYWLGGGMLCGSDMGSFSTNLRIGVDVPSGERPGGTTYRRELTADYFYPLSSAVSINGGVYYGEAEDQSGYSQLLDNNRHRKIARWVGRAALTWTLPWEPAGRWAAQFAYEYSQENSNINLFELTDRQFFAGVRYRF